jgi:hypothetical protein
MPKASNATASESAEALGFEGHYENLEGGYTVGFETYTEDADMAPLFKGLPDDRCQASHWGDENGKRRRQGGLETQSPPSSIRGSL